MQENTSSKTFWIHQAKGLGYIRIFWMLMCVDVPFENKHTFIFEAKRLGYSFCLFLN